MARELGVLNAFDAAKTQLYHFTAVVIAGIGFFTDAYDLGVVNVLDVAKTQLYHFNAIVTAGMGFFTDVYDLFCITLVTKFLGMLYYTKARPDAPKPGTLPTGVQSAVTGFAVCGTLAGELFFDWLGDKMGRKRVYGVTLMLMVVCSIASGLSFGDTPKGDMATLCLFGFWLGFGIGGDYPLSATIMSEYANKRSRGAFIAAVFAMQGFGFFAGGIITLIVLTLCGRSIKMFPSNVPFFDLYIKLFSVHVT